MTVQAYAQFIFDRITARDQHAPYSELISAWWICYVATKKPYLRRDFLSLPIRVKANEIFRTTLDLRSIGSVQLSVKQPQEMVELRWALPMRVVTGRFFQEENLKIDWMIHLLETLVKRTALTSKEAAAFDAAQIRKSNCTDCVKRATVWLDDLGIAIEHTEPRGWAPYAQGRCPNVSTALSKVLDQPS